MDRDTKKRKLSQEFPKEASTLKHRRMYFDSGMSKCESTQKSTLTEKIVSLWKSGSGSGPACIATQENKDIVKLQEFETKYKEADKTIQSIKKKLILSEENFARLNILLKKETTEKQILLNKMSTTWELVANISQHVNYVTESLDRFQEQISNLSNKYDNVILKLRSDNTVLHTEMKQLLNGRQTAVEEIQQKLNDRELEFNDLKVRCGTLEAQLSQEKSEAAKITDELNDGKRKLMEMEAAERKMKISIAELEEVVAVEKSELERMNVTEKENIRNNYELKVFELHKNYEETDKRLKEVEKKHVEILKSLEEKNNLIASQEQEINLYQKQIRELMCQLTDTALNFQCVKDEKAHLEMKMEVRDIELSRLRQELDTMIIENSSLTEDREKLKDSLAKGESERVDLTEDLNRSKKQLQEIMKRNNDMNKHLHQNNEHKDCEIEQLQLQMQVLKQNSDQVLYEKIEEYHERDKQLKLQFEHEIKIQTEKYKKSLEELDKLSDTIEDMKKEDSFIKSALSKVMMEKEELKDLFCKERNALESKLFESEKLITRKTANKKEEKIEEKISKLHMNLGSEEEKYKDLQSAKDNKIVPLEEKLLNLDLSKVSQPPITILTQKNTSKNTKNIHIKNDEIIASGKIKSILKPLVTLNSPKSSPKLSSKKISFNFGSDSSDDASDSDHQSMALSCNDKSDKLMKIELHSAEMQLLASQSSNSETPTKSKKFFKSRGNI